MKNERIVKSTMFTCRLAARPKGPYYTCKYHTPVLQQNTPLIGEPSYLILESHLNRYKMYICESTLVLTQETSLDNSKTKPRSFQ